ncbi:MULTISPECIES: flagellar protein MotY [Shewanella]|uniref:flagellar protein MotY n=1 Tax=Shewanella TaxID=22 RepID=UPI001C655C4D|nr:MULTISPECIES: OmpA family protein [Shewanella]QYJ77242.1 OmpA family protein [Shewanella sp. FJAT-52076]QYK07172.1 OmpA family protein [Shewanella zhangzhouensis]
MWRNCFILSALLLPLGAAADMRHYVATIADSQWRLAENSRIRCSLEHDIPAYGKAVFSSAAGKDQNLLFTLDMWSKPDAATAATLVSKAPSWRPGEVQSTITRLSYMRDFNGEVPKKAAWSMLTELERGREPTFYYADWYNSDNKVAVGLSAANFRRKYTEFRQCLSGLLPYSFDDIAFTVLNYESGGTELTRFSKAQLARVQEYLSLDPDVELILINAYTDSHGGRNLNQKVSDKRADSVKDFFVSKGIPADRIQTEGHGETRHVASNQGADERQRNRRVVIQITKAI